MKHTPKTPQPWPFPYQFIAIEGNIGAGKTTLTRMIAEDYGCRLVLEQFADNPFLPYFYENPERHAFTVELFFMTERHKQLQEELAQRDLFQQRAVADYFFLKTLLFARNNLTEEEYRLFQRLFHILNANSPKPDLIVYLHRPVENLIANIQSRGREYEQNISPEYLTQIQDAYFDFFKTEPSIPILIVDAGNLDFVRYPTHYQILLNAINQVHAPGVQSTILHQTPVI